MKIKVLFFKILLELEFCGGYIPREFSELRNFVSVCEERFKYIKLFIPSIIISLSGFKL